MEEGRICYALNCLHHPLHKDWVNCGKSMMDVVEKHSNEHGHIWCSMEIDIIPNGRCGKFVREKRKNLLFPYRKK